MRYPSKLLRRADSLLADRRRQALADQDQRKLYIQEHHPDIHQLRRQVLEHGILMGRALLTGDKELHGRALQDMESCSSRLRELLASAGLQDNYLEPWHACSKCGDRGYAGGAFCECRLQILNRLVYEMISNSSQADDCTFDNFSLVWYEGGTVRQMEKLLASCRRYAGQFSHASPSLIFMGPPGLGKTHLSLSIAREVVNAGQLVMYASAGSMLGRLVDSAFGDEGSDEYRELVYECDLLLIDDLGTEFKNSATRTEVYGLINTRINEKRPTIINTNLTLVELEAAYGQRVVSRLMGSYSFNEFAGTDIRFQKRMKLQRRQSNGETETGSGAQLLGRRGRGHAGDGGASKPDSGDGSSPEPPAGGGQGAG